MNLQPTLYNNLVLLRPLRSDDFEDLFAVAKDPLIWEQHPIKTRSSLEGFKEFFRDALQSKGTLVIIDRKSQKIIGSSRIKVIRNSKTAIEIGWSFLARKYWGGIYNQSFKKLMIDYLFQNGFEQVIFYIDHDNIRSQRAVEKTGGILLSNRDHPFTREKKDKLTYVLSNVLGKIT